MIYQYLNEKETVMKTQNRDGKLPDNGMVDKKMAIPSGSTAQSIANTNPEYLEIDILKWIKAQNNVVGLYRKYFYNKQSMIASDFRNDIGDKYPAITDNNGYIQFKNPEDSANLNSIIRSIALDENILRSANYTDQQIMNIITNGYFPESLSEKECRAAIDLILQDSKMLVSILTQMIRTNYAVLNISIQKVNDTISLLNNDSTVHKGMSEIKNIFNNPDVLKKYKLGASNYDFRPLGGGCMFLSKAPSVRVSYKPSRKINFIFKYDAVVMTHANEYKGKWICEPVSTLHHSNISDVIDLLYILRKEGFKNVFIGCCNPGGVEVPDDLKNDKNFHYTTPKQSTYLESDIYNDEQEIMSIYNELQILCNEVNIELLIEGKFTEFVKRSIKRISELVKKLWARLVEFFNKIIRSISEKVGRLLNIPNSKTKFKEPIEVSFVSFSGKAAKVDKKKCYSAEDIKHSVDEANKSINNAIKIHQQKVDQAIKNAEQRLKQIGVKESGIFINTDFM